MIKNKKAIAGMLVIGGMVAGAVGSVGVAVHAQSAPVVQATTSQAEVVTVNDPQDVPDNNESGHNKVDQVATEAKATVKTAQAVATAEASVGAKSVRSHIEDENGVISYDVFFADKKVEVDSTTGAITKTEAKQERENNEAPGTEVPDAQEAGN
jgi:uncharacterized membrane protein YkoI